MGKALDLTIGNPTASTNVLTKDAIVQPMMDANAERLECEPILDVMRSTRDLIKHVVVDVPLQTFNKFKRFTIDVVTAPFLKVAQIATNVKNAVHGVLGGSMAVLETAFTPVAHVGAKIKGLKSTTATAAAPA